MLTGLADRITDAMARRPNGWLGRFVYRSSLAHKSGFRLVLDTVPVGKEDRVLDVCCGGGVFLEQLLRRAASAAGIDHSNDMLGLSRNRNVAALAEGRLALTQGDVTLLPYGDREFTRIFCLNAFFFVPDPQATLLEMARVLEPGGYLAILTMPPDCERGMRWVFGPIARRMRFDPPDLISEMAAGAGLVTEAVHAAPGGSYLYVARKTLLES
ncbi:methyltransferase domain-containing protein [Nisaea sp.]|uniref:class I SAM-dependent methyltransferase n=1 Tax=Nisaea sp. TaxID=2024842 RepID=UPI0032981F82